MTTPTTPTPPRPTLTSLTQLPAGLEQQLASKQEARTAKVKRTGLGVLFVAIGLLGLVLAGYLAIQKAEKSIIFSAGAGGVGFLFFGALLADSEAVWPVMRAMLAYAKAVIALRKSA